MSAACTCCAACRAGDLDRAPQRDMDGDWMRCCSCEACADICDFDECAAKARVQRGPMTYCEAHAGEHDAHVAEAAARRPA